MTRTHASFFSGAGGTDIGLERAGWRTVSFSEIDPYASAVLAHRWPGVPNLGSIADLAGRWAGERGGDQRPDDGRDDPGDGGRPAQHDAARPDWRTATLWSGGFPCQDLSVAGKRRGMGTHADRSDTRSGLAYAFLDLVGRYRPPAILLENVPGLLSSHRGRDFYALQRRMAELGYVGAYRILDGRHFGVPQRRRRVFIVALDARRGATADDAAEVLSVGSRCQRHPATGGEAGPGPAGEPGGGAVGTFTAGAHPGSYNGQDAYTGHLIADSVGALNNLGHHGWTANAQSVAQGHIIRQAPDAHRDRETDGLAGRAHDRAGVAFVKGKRAQSVEDDESWREGDVALTPDVAATMLASPEGGTRTMDLNQTWVDGGEPGGADPLLPLGLDSHRYRCCGNGVIAPVAEWIGERLAAWALGSVA